MILHSVSYGPESDAEPVVFLGSIASTTDMWLPQLDELSKTRRVIALDHRGHGQSPDPDVAPGDTTFDHLAEDVLSTLDQLGVDKFQVVGLSLGGAIAQYMALTSPRVTRAGFLCTAAYFGGPEKWNPRAELTRAEGLEPMADGVIDFWLTKDFQAAHPATTARYRRMVVSTRGSGYASASDALAHWDIRERLAEITVPVLVLAASDDQSTPPSALKAIAEGVTGEATFVEVSPGAHVPTIEVPEQVTQALVEFFG
ncbi:MAG: alpha/beta fold hydrolase [Corynebacterium sp.]|uniref:alpha/beta fold hydrolase n=1 Tax=Corynebacterium sp. TaxID=1720 RepID=UPI0026E0D2C6|nr:alpha/beta fold hydrolase [Corynebacterium sp.]MDO5669959.1 alpha/beta fold hydrolase [Corynebacterium sp.]